MGEKKGTRSESDDDIVRQVRNGNRDAFAQLLERYGDYIMRLVRRHVPQDQVEETAHLAFVRAYQSLDNFKKMGAFKQWLSSIAVRSCYDFWRERYRSKEYALSTLTNEHQEWLENAFSDTSDETFLEEGSRKEARELLDWALAKLSPEDRMVIELVYLEELSVKEAADLLGWSAANVKVRSFRSRKKLHSLISGLMKG